MSGRIRKGVPQMAGRKKVWTVTKTGQGPEALLSKFKEPAKEISAGPKWGL